MQRMCANKFPIINLLGIFCIFTVKLQTNEKILFKQDKSKKK